MPAPAPAIDLAVLSDPDEYRAFVARHGPPGRDFFVRTAETLAQETRTNPALLVDKAERLEELAAAAGPREWLAWAQRAHGNVCFACGDYRAAVDLYRKAIEGFGTADAIERGRTLSSLLHPLAMLGDSAGSLEAAESARACFESAGDRRRIARLDINLASVWFREDRFPEALDSLEHAEQGLRETPDGAGDHEAWAAILVSRAVVLINLARFADAEAAYRSARAYALAHAMPALVAQAEYNIGYLYFLRGEHVKAIRALDQARATAIRHGDKLHRALCDLDQADVCIELHLYQDALALANQALSQFEALEMRYEQGKALGNMAVAQQFLGHDSAAVELLERAQRAFADAGNDFWVHLSGLYRGAVLLKMGRCYEAKQLGQRAAEYFRAQHHLTKAVYATLVTARARAGIRDFAGADQDCAMALDALASLPAPWLLRQAQAARGELSDLRGDLPAALAAYAAAIEIGEATASHINFDEIRVATTADRSRVYELYLDILLRTAPAAEAVWTHLERAKAHALALAMAGDLGSLEAPVGEGSRVVHEISRLREELNWYYRQLSPSEPSAGIRAKDPREGVVQVLSAIQQRENDLLRSVRQLPGDEYEITEAQALPAWERLRPLLRQAHLIEYFPAGSGLMAVVGDERGLRWMRLPGERAAIESALRLLRFQVGRHALEGGHFERHQGGLRLAAESHLDLLHQLLLAPLLPWLEHPRWFVVPHGILHAVPFAALGRNGCSELEARTISLAPSAAALLAATARPPSRSLRHLLLRPEAEQAQAEAAAVAAALPPGTPTTTLAGEACTLEAVRRNLGASRRVHIAAPSDARTRRSADAALGLSDGQLNVIDLRHLRLDADLVVLCGYAASLDELTASTERFGLDRAFLHAGARSVLTTLWPLGDAILAEFLAIFYPALDASPCAADALRRSQLAFRQRHPHPYFWAPFQLLGAG